MTIESWLARAIHELERANIATARLDCLVLLEDALHKDRSWLLAHPEEPIPDDTLAILNNQIARRAEHEPLAYVRGKTEFYGREFAVNAHTLEPRPETEDMIDLFKELEVDAKEWRVADIGTGSGAIGLTAALEIPGLEPHLTDIDLECLQTAERNAEKHGVRASFVQGNLLEPLLPFRPLPRVLLCNLPYVPDSHTINEAAMQEPPHAIFGGPDGLALYRELFAQIDALNDKPRYILTESLPFQHEVLAGIAKQHGYMLQETRGFIQLFNR